MKNPLLNTAEGSPEEDHMVGSFVRQRGQQALRERYAQRIAQDHGIHRPSRKRVLQRFLPAAAAAVVLLALGTFAWLNQPSPMETLLADNLYVEDYYVPINRSSAPNDESQLTSSESQLLLSFGAKRFQEVIALEPMAKSPTARFYVGLALISQERDAEARTVMQGLLDDTSYGEEARWYDTLLALRMGDRVNAKSALATYTPNNLSYYQKAQELLRAMEKN
jgi:hypothetical protein